MHSLSLHLKSAFNVRNGMYIMKTCLTWYGPAKFNRWRDQPLKFCKNCMQQNSAYCQFKQDGCASFRLARHYKICCEGFSGFLLHHPLPILQFCFFSIEIEHQSTAWQLTMGSCHDQFVYNMLILAVLQHLLVSRQASISLSSCRSIILNAVVQCQRSENVQNC